MGCSGSAYTVYWQLMGSPLEIITVHGAIGDELYLYITGTRLGLAVWGDVWGDGSRLLMEVMNMMAVM